MADSMPRMEWLSPNIGETFQLFKQKADLYFSVKKITGENQVNHILLAVGDEGLKRFNSWNLSADDRKNPKTIWEKFEAQLEPSENFRVSRLKLRYYRQGKNESLDDFVNRCKLLTMKCKFTGKEMEERLIEQIIASTPLADYQKELLSKDEEYSQEDAIKLGLPYHT